MPKTAWKTLMYAVETQRGWVFVMWILVAIGNGVAFSVPYFFKLIIDYVTTTPIANFQIYDLRFPILGVVLFLIMQEASFRIAHMMEVGIVVHAFRRVTTMLYHNLIERPSSYFEERLSGELGRRVEQVGTSVVFFTEQFPWEMAWVILGFSVATVLLFIASPYFLLVFGVWALFFFPTSVLLLRWQYQWSQHVATVHARLSGNTVDSLSQILRSYILLQRKKKKKQITLT